MAINKRRAVTLLEIMIATFILAAAVLPIIMIFTKYYGVATKQNFQENALKIGEAATNKILASRFSALANGDSFTLPLNLQTPEGTFAGALTYSGDEGHTDYVTMTGCRYKIEVRVRKIYIAQNPMAPPSAVALVFKYGGPAPTPLPGDPPPPPPPPPGVPPTAINKYFCTDDFISVRVTVKYGDPEREIDLMTFRADMNK